MPCAKGAGLQRWCRIDWGMAEMGVLLRTLWPALRPHHWVKNLLVFVPVLTAQRWAEPQIWALAGAVFVAFSLCSSAVYLTNDVWDIDDDRAHPVKRHRPIASGRLRPEQAILVAVLLTGVALGLSMPLGAGWVLLVYIIWSFAYSAKLKTLAVADVVSLVGFYMLRLLAGGEATGIPVSGWLLAYGGSIFASLALAKRSAELGGAAAGDLPLPQRRGYRPRDHGVLMVAGVVAAVGSGIVLLLYVAVGPARQIYDRPEWLMLSGGVVLVWLLRVWRLASQSRLHSDPIVFALRDPVSLISGVGALALFLLATV